MRKILSLFLAFCFLICIFSGCNTKKSDASAPLDENHKFLNGRSISEYTIIYSSDSDYNFRAATYLSEQIKERTGITLDVKSDKEQETTLKHEIVVGHTNREISKSLNIKTENVQFSMFADDSHIALEGEQFIIAAAAYYFVDTYIGYGPFDSNVEKKKTVHNPIVKKAKNCIFLIGDGMGVNQTKLFENYTADGFGLYSDGEIKFYGNMFPYIGLVRTNSRSGTTDSAAGGTALATGYKTHNGRIGMDGNYNNVKSITELAIELNKSVAIMTTDLITGATPAAFSSHAKSRDFTDDILLGQKELEENNGVIFFGGYGLNYEEEAILALENDFNNTLTELSKNKNGFFIMYEEAGFDKHGHNGDIVGAFMAGVRFNQIIASAMEYAFYNPETFVIMTADHETGGIKMDSNGRYACTTTTHTNADVPVFAYGYDANVFGDVTIENIQIPKTIAAMWGEKLPGYEDELYPALDLDADKKPEKQTKDDNFTNFIILSAICLFVLIIGTVVIILIVKKKKQKNIAEN